MSKLLRWLGGVAFSVTVALALGFGAQQALASDAEALLCSGTCPDLDACISCCIVAGGNNGACFGTTCFCIG